MAKRGARRWAVATATVGVGVLGIWGAWKWTTQWQYRNDPVDAPVFPVQGGTWPVKRIRQFGYDRSKQKSGHAHQGVDIYEPKGTPILAAVAGTVERSCDRLCSGFNGYGRIVVIKSNPNMGAPTLWWLYAHMDRVMVSKGDKVEKGQQIGTLGDSCFSKTDPTNDCNIPHLHFEISPRKYPQNSENWRYSPKEMFAALGSEDAEAQIAVVQTTANGPLIA